MKLRNKKTGEIGEIGYIGSSSGKLTVKPINGVACESLASYTSLAELNEEWEDYEEPKEYWTIDWACTGVTTNKYSGDDIDDFNKSIGNYFSSREEARKAVEKLKAYKRLKDKGFMFTLIPGVGSLDVTPGKFQIEINAEMPEKWFCCDAVQKDLDDCFGGEE